MEWKKKKKENEPDTHGRNEPTLFCYVYFGRSNFERFSFQVTIGR